MEYTFFWTGEFSQWYPAFFVVDDVEYNCAEQYMMAQKALLFNDLSSYSKIMDAVVPKIQKDLGRKVLGFDPVLWENNCKQIVFDGNLAKFSQNESLKEVLRETIGTLLVEASPYDTIWGIGIGPKDPLRLDPKNWKGKNYLGEVLTSVRKEIFHDDGDL